MTVTFQDIEAARDRIRGQVDHTPTRHSRRLSELTGAEVWVKFDNLHFTGSFKERGALNRLMLLDADERKRGVVAASAGNHAQALAYHGGRLGIPVTIVMPEGTPFVKIDGTRRHGARVVIEGADFTGSTAEAHRLRDEEGFVFISAFDDEGIVAGQGVCAMEFLEDAPDLEEMIIPIGGGGLIAGCSIAAEAIRPELQVHGVEAAMYPSFTARRRGETPKCGGATIAEGIAIKAVGDIPFALADPRVKEVFVCQEADFEKAVAFYATLEKTVAEGAGAGGLAALLANPDRFKGRKVGLVLCGGNIDTRLLANVLLRDLVRSGRMARLRITLQDRPGALFRVMGVFDAHNVNILEIHHQRIFTSLPAKGLFTEIECEARDANQMRGLVAALRDKGYSVEEVAVD